MPILFHPESREFHLQNHFVSYILKILDNGQPANVYFGKRIHDRADFSYLLYDEPRSLSVHPLEGNDRFCPQYLRWEYPFFGTGDFRYPAASIQQPNGSRVVHFVYRHHEIFPGKRPLAGLPATYVEQDDEAETLELTLTDALLGAKLVLRYTIFREYAAIARSVYIANNGTEPFTLEHMLSAAIDLPDARYEMLQLQGAWGRERHPVFSALHPGVQSVGSLRGASSAEFNPFLALKRPHTTEQQGEAYGFSLVYSGNHLEQVEVDTHGMVRVALGIHPHTFCWPLMPGEGFQTPEAVLVYSDRGLGGMSQTFHRLYAQRLVRGHWRDRERPVLINNWEATDAHFTEEKLLRIAAVAKDAGIELFVLDDGWFGERDNDRAGLGDWHITNRRKLPDGLAGLSAKLKALGLAFGLWIEPEMVNKDSELYRMHPDWILQTPARYASPGRHQHVLDLSRTEVVDYLYKVLAAVIEEAGVVYVKWDMNRYITECFSAAKPAQEQGKVYHQYILGVYSLYERLVARFPKVLFESCSSGGARFDPGMLYYAPQTWTSDNTDAVERLHIQYGTSYVYPPGSMGNHVSCVPNQQVNRTTPLETRAAVAYWGAFGYELDLEALSPEEKQKIREQVGFMKRHRKLLQYGDFYRLSDITQPGAFAWMCVSPNKQEAMVGYFQVLRQANEAVKCIKLAGLQPEALYWLEDGRAFYGDQLMYAGIPIRNEELCPCNTDFASKLLYFSAAKA